MTFGILQFTLPGVVHTGYSEATAAQNVMLHIVMGTFHYEFSLCNVLVITGLVGTV